MDISTKCEFINLLIKADKWKSSLSENPENNKYQFLTGGIMKIIYFNVMLPHLSLFFYKCIDPIHVLEFYTAKNKEINEFGGGFAHEIKRGIFTTPILSYSMDIQLNWNGIECILARDRRDAFNKGKFFCE